MTRIVAILMLALVGLSGAGAWGDAVYVSPGGDDGGRGTRQDPFRTLEQARDAVRRIPAHRARKVVLGEGIYRITGSLVLGTEDSGETWEASKGTSVRFMGGANLTDWQPVTEPGVLERLDRAARPHVVQCELAGVGNLGTVQPQGGIRAELFFNHHYMTLARYPNGDWLRIADVPADAEYKFQDKDDPSLVRHRGPFQYDGERPARWGQAPDIWIHGYWTYDWADEYEAVERLDLEKSLVWPKPPYHGYGYTKDQRYYFLNILEELDEPGEWYLDRDAKRIYFWPPDTLDSAEITFPDLEQPMVVLEGASRVVLRGITFECTRAEAVVVKGGAGNEICGCVLRNVGRAAIDIRGGTGHAVRGCDIYETAATGVAVDGGDRATLAPGNHLVENCDIHHYARVQKTYQPAVSLNGAGNRMAHCYIHDAPHQGVAYSGNDHVIEYCEITRIAQETGDVGAIYTAMDWTYAGLIFRYNYFHGIHGPGNLGCFVIYPDLPCGGIHLYGNVFRDFDQGFHTNSGRGMLIENNIFTGCARTFRFNVWGQLPMFQPGGAWQMTERLEKVKYDQPPYSTRYPFLARLAEDFAKSDLAQRTIPRDNVIRRNITQGFQFLCLGAEAGLQDVKVESNLICNSMVMAGSPTGDGHGNTYTCDDNRIRWILGASGNIVSADEPGLVNPDADDFRVQRNSPARKLGFDPIPFDEIGLRVDANRRRLPLRAPAFDTANRLFVGEMAVGLAPNRGGGVFRYTLDGSEPTAASPRYRGAIRLRETTTLTAAAFDGGGMGEVARATFTRKTLGERDCVYMSDLRETEYVGPDGLGCTPLTKDKAPGGTPLRLGGKEYGKCLVTDLIGTTRGPLSRIGYRLDCGLRHACRFNASIGIDDGAGDAKGGCVFVVETRCNGSWQQAYKSDAITRDNSPREVDVPLAGADALRLAVMGTGAGGWPRITWANPRME